MKNKDWQKMMCNSSRFCFDQEDSAIKQIKGSDGLVKDTRSYVGEDGKWNVYPVGYTDQHCTADVFVVCPHCGEIHLNSYARAVNGYTSCDNDENKKYVVRFKN